MKEALTAAEGTELRVLDLRGGDCGWFVRKCCRIPAERLIEDSRLGELSSGEAELYCVADAGVYCVIGGKDENDLRVWFKERGWTRVHVWESEEAARRGGACVVHGIAEVESQRLWLPNPLLLRWFESMVPSVLGKIFVDLGTGRGRDAVYLASHGARVLCLEKREVLLRSAHQLATANNVKTVAVDSLDAAATTAMAAEPSCIITWAVGVTPQIIRDLKTRLSPEVFAVNISRFFPRLLWPQMCMLTDDWLLVHNFMPGSEWPTQDHALLSACDLRDLSAYLPGLQVRLNETHVIVDRRGTRVLSMYIARLPAPASAER